MYKSCQNLSSAVGFTKIRVLATRAFAAKFHQNISSSVGVTKSRAFGVQMLSKYFYFCRSDQK